MIVLSSEQIRKADAFTISNEPISSVDLMERAAVNCYKEIVKEIRKDQITAVVCGPGNNGGDGLVIARLMKEAGFNVEVYLIGEKFSDDNKINQERLKKTGVELKTTFPALEDSIAYDFIIDAVFGTGLKKTPEGDFAEAIRLINSSGAKIISVDMPSGMADEVQFDFNLIVKADFTFTFQFLKLSFLLPDSGPYCGEWCVIDIGLLKEGYQHEKPVAVVTGIETIQKYFPKRDKFSHKGTYGHVCLIGGSFGKMGAMVLAARGCLNTGAGLTTVVVPECGYEIIQTTVPEAMVRVSRGANYHEEFNTGKTTYDAIGIGPGMDTERETADSLKLLIQNASIPLVLDADALNIISENKTWLAFLPANSVLTPHPGEFKKLAGEWNNAFEMIQKQKDFAFKYQCYVVLKGAYTCIATPGGNLFFNSTGNPGLAKGGSGDSLTGIISALMARGLSSLESCLAGTFLHGLAADLAVKEINENSLVASDVIDKIKDAIDLIQE